MGSIHLCFSLHHLLQCRPATLPPRLQGLAHVVCTRTLLPNLAHVACPRISPLLFASVPCSMAIVLLGLCISYFFGHSLVVDGKIIFFDDKGFKIMNGNYLRMSQQGYRPRKAVLEVTIVGGSKQGKYCDPCQFPLTCLHHFATLAKCHEC